MLSNYPVIRRIIYVIGIIAQVASFFAPVFYPELTQPLGQTADFLGVVAIGTAVSNVTKKPAGAHEA